MGYIGDEFNRIFRDFSTDGVPASGLHEPVKADIRALGQVIDAALNWIAAWDTVANISPSGSAGPTYNGLFVGGNPGVVKLVSPGGVITSYADCYNGQEIVQDFVRVHTHTTATGLVGVKRVGAPVAPVPSQAPLSVAPADADLPEGPAKAISVGAAGRVTIKAFDGASGSTATFNTLPAGTLLRILTIQVKAGTTATGVLAYY